jgi:hypothetical protein
LFLLVEVIWIKKILRKNNQKLWLNIQKKFVNKIMIVIIKKGINEDKLLYKGQLESKKCCLKKGTK